MSDCPKCEWSNIYRHSSDGSREWEAREHALTHEDEE